MISVSDVLPVFLVICVALLFHWLPVCFRPKSDIFNEDSEIVHALALDCFSSLTSYLLVPLFSSWLVFHQLHCLSFHSSEEPAFRSKSLHCRSSAHWNISVPHLCMINVSLFIRAQFKLGFSREFYSNLISLVRFPCKPLHSI